MEIGFSALIGIIITLYWLDYPNLSLWDTFLVATLCLCSTAAVIFTSSILAGTCAIAAGVAYALKESGSDNWVYCFLGDGAEEQGHFYEAVMWVEAQDLPCMFIIEDNDRQVDTSFEESNPNKFKFEMPSCVIRNHYKPTYPHAGNGTSKKIVFKDIK